MNNLTAVKGLEMPTGDKRCKLAVKRVQPLCNCRLFDCDCTREVSRCVITLTHCEGFEHDKADDCPMFELKVETAEDDTGELPTWYMEVKP